MRRSKVDFNYLINPTSKFSAYILGFIWGDGYINWKTQRVSIEIVKTDFDEISSFIDLSNWLTYTRNRKGRKEQIYSCISDTKIIEFLKSNGFENKSGKCPSKIINFFDKQVLHYWFRGYSDSDGCFYINHKNYLRQYSLASTYDQDWSVIKTLCNNLDIQNYQIQQRLTKNGNSSCFRISKAKEIFKFGNFIYQDYNNLGLERKYNKYLEIINTSKRL